MLRGGGECIRNSLVCKIVSVSSKYRGAVTCEVTPVFWVTLCFVECVRTGYVEVKGTHLRPQWPSLFRARDEAWFEVMDENGSLEVAWNPRGCFALPYKNHPRWFCPTAWRHWGNSSCWGCGAGQISLVGKQRSPAPRARPPARGDCFPQQLQRRHDPDSNRGNEFIMPQSLHFHHAQISP